ncbi:MAG: hypothetical protein ACLUSN_10540 [Blautia wexlerae]
MTLDLDGVIAPEELPEFERQVNEAIGKTWRSKFSINQRRTGASITGAKRSKVRYGSSGSGIMIPVPVGTHVERTGEIRLIKLLGLQNYKGGVRISMLTEKTRSMIMRKSMPIQEATHLLSVKRIRWTGFGSFWANTAMKSKLIAFQRQVGEEKPTRFWKEQRRSARSRISRMMSS